MCNCKIDKVTFKPGVHALPENQDSVLNIKFGWGEITFRCYDGTPISNETAVYMLRGAENKLLHD